MKRTIALFSTALLSAFTLLLGWVFATESGLSWAYQRAKPFLPGELTLSKLQGRLIGPISVEGINYQLGPLSVTAGQMTFDWLPSALLSTTLNINRVQVKSLEILLPPSNNSDNTDKANSLPDIHLPWRLVLGNLLLEDMTLKRDGETLHLRQIRLNSTALLGKINIEELYVEANHFNLNIKGKLRPGNSYSHHLKVKWQAELPSKAIIQGKGHLVGDMNITQLTQQLSGPLELSIKADLRDMLDKLSWQAKLSIKQFDAQQLNSAWPAFTGALNLDAKGNISTASFSGTMNGNYSELGPFDAEFDFQRLGDNSIQIDRLKLHAPHTDTHLEAHGQWIPAVNGGDIKLSLNWQNLCWPTQTPSRFNSAHGDGSIEGNIDHYKIQLTSDNPWSQLPPSSWSAQAEGNLDGLTIQSLRVTALDGEAIATGQVNWSPTLSWKADITTTDLNPGNLWPEWPGQLNAAMTSSGHIEKGRLIADTEIIQLSGQLRTYPVSLRSRLTWRDHGLDIAHFDFSSAKARVNVQGRAGETSKLKWHINAPDLAALYPQAKGQLQAEGTLSGPLQSPTISALIKGKGLALPDYEIATIKTSFAADLFRWQNINIKLAAQGLNLKTYTIKSLNINGDSQHLLAKAVTDEGSAKIELNGEIKTRGWNGHIERATIQTRQFSNWQLTTPALLTIKEKTLEAEPLCWQNSHAAKICASLQRDDVNWRSQFDIKNLSLLLFSRWFPEDLKVEGLVNASAKLHFQDPRQVLGQATIELPPGVVHYPLLEGERDNWGYRGGNLNITLKEQGVEANAEIAMGNGDQFQFNATLPGAQLLSLNAQQQVVHAQARLAANDLGLIEALIPEIQNLQGELAIDLSATGTLAQPRINGHANLLKGALRIPRLGLSIDQLSLNSESSDFEKINFHLKAKSGDGNIAVEGETTLNRKSGWPTEITIKGDAFEISRIPEAQIMTSPDLRIKLQKRAINITGDVHIPYARLQPKDITTAARVSDDAVILGDEQAVIEKWAITSKIRLTLGDRVNFYGYGFEGRLGGRLLLEDEPGQLTRATGEINIPEGRYRAYGQRLDVERGRLIFSGGPLGNPGLDARAVRHVNNVTAGLKIRGNLHKPQLELFSIPAMGQTETLAYLLLGRPLDKASSEDGNMMAQGALALGLSGGDRIARALGRRFGIDEMRVESNDSGDQASLMMGRYLSPRLYVGYGVGLVKAINTFNVRYQMSDEWQLKGESGEYSGMDILYTIDR